MAKVRINVGGPALTDTNGDWIADSSSNPAEQFSGTTQFYGINPAGIDMTHPSVPAGTPPELFADERYLTFSDNASYTFTVVPGNTYTIRPYLAELYFQSGGARVYDILVDGVVVFDNVDPFTLAGGAQKAVVLSADVTATSSTLVVTFGRVVENPAVQGLELEGDFGGGSTPVELGGNAPVTVTPSAALQVEKPLGASPAVAVNAAGGLFVNKLLTAAAPVSVTFMGGLLTEKTLVSGAAVTVDPAAALQVEKLMAGGVPLSVLPEAVLQVVKSLSSVAGVSLTPQGALLVEKLLAGDVEIVILPRLGLGVYLSGDAGVSVGSTGNLLVEKHLFTSTEITLTAGGVLSAPTLLSSAVAVLLQPTAALQVEKLLNGAANIVILPAGTLVGEIPLVRDIQATVRYTGVASGVVTSRKATATTVKRGQVTAEVVQ